MDHRLVDGIHTSQFEIIIAKAYLYFLPFRLFTQLVFLKGIVGVCANYMPFVFHVMGLIVWIINERGTLQIYNTENNAFLKRTMYLVVYLNVSSIIMAIVIQSVYGDHGGENAFSGIAGMMIYFTQYLMMFVYCGRIFELLDRQTINKILHRVCLVLLLIGYFQILVMNGIGGGIYNALNVFGTLNASTRLPKLCLTGSEGATAGCIIGVFVLPFLLSKVIETGKTGYILQVLAWLIPLFFTYSSTAYILAAVVFAVFALLFFQQGGDSSKLMTLVAIIALVCILGFVLLQTGILNNEIMEKINYILIKKATDKDNGSTISRTVPLLVNWGAFTEYPFLGVGNGLQGYFYEKYFPDWALNAAGSDVSVFLQRSQEQISNAGIFIPGLLSGYGIVGCVIIILWAVELVRMNRSRRYTNANFYSMFIMSAIAFVAMGFQGDAYGMYFAWFMLALPLYDGSKDEAIESDNNSLYQKNTRVSKYIL